nr:hypothetical protein HAGR004_37890 [Bdellovibrio sp. HAGR004]
MKNDNENTAGIVGTVASEAVSTTIPTLSTTAERTKNENDHLVMSWAKRFMPVEIMGTLFIHELKRRGEWKSEEQARQLFQETYDATCNELAEKDNDWRMQLMHIFGGLYPSSHREFYFGGSICQKIYPKANPHTDNRRHTFSSESYSPLKTISGKLAERLAPATFRVWRGEKKVHIDKTSETVRFLNFEREAFLKSALHEVVIYDRPVYQIKTGWHDHDSNRLPKKTYAAEITSTKTDETLLKSFVDDLKSTFAWDHDSNSFVNYLGYLIQPMLAHLAPGQLPGYLFLGPTKSGKNCLSDGLVSYLYSRRGQSTVKVAKLPSGPYEVGVFLGNAAGSIFLVFDEVKNATDEELKALDSLLTSGRIQTRQMRQGYIELDNYFVIGLTSVHKGLTDETEGRLVKVTLTESRPEAIGDFMKRWTDKFPELLSTLFFKLSQVVNDESKYPRISDRRPGFQVIAYFVNQVFGYQPNYSVDATVNDFLDDICLMYEEVHEVKNASKGRISIKQISDYLNNKHRFRFSRDRLINELNTALGYGSTKKHPSYKDAGYQAENGKHYHIRIVREGIKTKRYFLYIECLDDKSEKDQVEDRMKILAGELGQTDQAVAIAH